MVCFKDLEIGDFFLDTDHDFPGIKISENKYFNRKTKKIYTTILGDIYIFKKCDPENTRPHGKWLEWVDERWGGTTIYCSVCKLKALRSSSNHFVMSNFCPQCGADMRGNG